MTILQIINKVENFKQPNASEQQELEWINEIDRTILEDIIKKHIISDTDLDNVFHCIKYTNDDKTEWEYITSHTYPSEEVFCPDRYCNLYLYFLLAKIDELNGDLTRFSNDMAMYQSYYLEYGNWLNREYQTIPVKLRY